MSSDDIKLMLETFQKFTRRGNEASLFLETRNGEQFETLRVKMKTSKSEAENTWRMGKRKSPSTVRRDKQRLETFLQRKTLQESLGRSPSATSTPNNRPGLSSPCQEVLTGISTENEPVNEKKLEEEGLHQEAILETEKEKDNANEVRNDEKAVAEFCEAQICEWAQKMKH